MTSSSQRVLVFVVLLTAALNIIPIADEFWLQTYDGETHLFFADHYRRAWWDPWEEKWLQGFWVYSYPPLVHQLVALAGRLPGLESGYRIVQLLTVTAYPLGAWLLGTELLGSDAADHAAALAFAPAGLYLALYSFGQLPNVVGAVLTLFALTALARYLRDGGRLRLLAWAGLSGAVFGAHHFTAIFNLVPAAAAVAVFSTLSHRGRPVRPAVMRIAASALALGGVAILAIIPFWWWFFTQRAAVAEIAHPTRLPFLQMPELRDLFFLRPYGVSILFVPFALLWFLRGRSRWPFAVLMGGWVLLGLGGNTPVPRLLLGRLWTYLVFDRFTLMAAMFAPLAAGDWLAAVGPRVRRLMIVAAVIPAVVISAGAAAYTRTRGLLPPLQAWERDEMRRFLEAENHASWHYVTLGLGDNEFQHLSRITSARTVDGYYTTARRNLELRRSGIGSFDSAFYFAGGRAAVRSLLEHPEAWSLKWALVRDARFEPLLKETGWKRAFPLGSDATWRPGDPVYSTVMIWYAPDPIPAIADPVPSAPPVFAVLWGLVPLALFAAGIGSFVRSAGRPA